METLKSSKIIDRAKNEVTGFTAMYQKLEQKVILGGMSNSTLLNYGLTDDSMLLSLQGANRYAFILIAKPGFHFRLLNSIHESINECRN